MQERPCSTSELFNVRRAIGRPQIHWVGFGTGPCRRTAASQSSHGRCSRLGPFRSCGTSWGGAFARFHVTECSTDFARFAIWTYNHSRWQRFSVRHHLRHLESVGTNEKQSKLPRLTSWWLVSRLPPEGGNTAGREPRLSWSGTLVPMRSSHHLLAYSQLCRRLRVLGHN